MVSSTTTVVTQVYIRIEARLRTTAPAVMGDLGGFVPADGFRGTRAWSPPV